MITKSSTRIVLALLVGVVLFVAPACTQKGVVKQLDSTVVINEFLAINDTDLAATDGDNSDWIELYNNSSSTVNLEGWSLTDDELQPRKWVFPAISIPADGYMVVFASDDDITTGTELHTNFKLGGNGEYLALIPPGDTATPVSVFTPEYPVQYTDVSFGYYEPVSDWRYFAVPTPGAANEALGDIFASEAEPVVFDYARGFYDSPFVLTLSSVTASAQIYYTLNGTEPTDTSGTSYSGPILIDDNAVVRARAYASGYIPSKVVTNTYLIGVSDLQKGLPAISIVADPGESLYAPNGIMAIEGGTYQPDYLTLFGISIPLHSKWTISDSANDYNFPLAEANPWAGNRPNDPDGRFYERPTSVEYIDNADNSGFQVDCGIRVQGSEYHRRRFKMDDGTDGDPKKEWWRPGVGALKAIWASPYKFSFKLYFRGDYGPKKLEYPLFENSPVQTFDILSLRGGHNDGFNPFIHDELSRRLFIDMGYVNPRGTLVNVFINGVYRGYYNPCERLHESFFREWYNSDNDWAIMRDNNVLEAGSEERIGYDALDAFTQDTVDMSLDSNYQAISEILDVQSFIDFLILELYIANEDWPNQNWAMAREVVDGAKWQCYVWDAEASFRPDNLAVTGFNNFPTDAGGNGLNGEGLGTHYSVGDLVPRLYRKLKENPDFVQLFSDRAHLHFEAGGALSPDNVKARFNELHADMMKVFPEGQGADDPYIGTEYDNFLSDRRDFYHYYTIIRDVWADQRKERLVSDMKNEGLYFDQGTIKTLITPTGAVAEGAQWRVDGGEWLDSGVQLRVIPGSYLIEYKPVTDWITPEAEEYSVSANTTTTVTVEYIYGRTGNVFVQVTPDTASWLITDSKGGTHSGTGLAALRSIPAGDATINWLGLPSYDSPAAETQAVVENITITFSGEYTPYSGSVVVDVSPDTATWSFTDSGGGNYSGAGDVTIPNVPTGPVTLVWDSLEGYTKPSQPASKTLARNEQITFMGEYVRHHGTVNVNVTPNEASWSFTDSDGGIHTGTGDAVLTDIPEGEVLMDWADLTGYHAPADSLQTLVKDSSVTFSGTYVRLTNTVVVEVTPDTASWSFIDGNDVTHSGTGDDVVQEVPTGEITLTWQPLANYDTPDQPAVQTLTSGNSVTFTGVYTRQLGSVVVSVTPDTAAWSLTDGEGASHSGAGDETLTDTPAGTISLTWQALENYVMPSPATVSKSLAKDGTVTFVGTYVPVPPDIFYVDISNDTGVEDGSAAHPYNTIAEAIEQVSENRGDVVLVKPGTYVEEVVLKEGMILAGESGAYHTVIAGSNGKSTTSCLVKLTDGCVIRGFTLKGTSGIAVTVLDNAEAVVTNCVFDVAWVGVTGQDGASIRLENNTFHSNASGVLIETTALVSVLRNNIFTNNNVAVNVPSANMLDLDYNLFNGNGTTYSEGDGGSNDVQADPLYLSLLNGNYHLTSTSPCRDGGDPASAYSDVDGSRNDMGADGGPDGVEDTQSPLAVASLSPLEGYKPLTVFFDGRSSTDEWGIDTYSWDVDSLDGIGADMTGATGSYTYETSGSYVVTLTVTDHSGLSASTTQTVEVGQGVPVVNAWAINQTGMAPLGVQFYAQGIDPDVGEVSYSWDFGDGVGTGDISNPLYTYPAGTSVGAYTAVVTVTDDEGDVSSASIPVTITSGRVDASTTISTEGGEVVVTDDSSPLHGVQAQLPAGAVGGDTHIIIGLANPSSLPRGRSNSMFELGPIGRVLSVPAQVTVPFSTTKKTTPYVGVEYQDDDGEWTSTGISDIQYNTGAEPTVSFATTQLAVFAVVQYVVPDVVGLEKTAAQEAVEQGGYTYSELTPDYSATVPEGSVISQIPAAGLDQPKERPIYVVLSLGKDTNDPNKSPASCSGAGQHPFSKWNDLMVLLLVVGGLVTAVRLQRRKS